mmetsp:Transcript_14609/g.33208  ORF Transcript_14609/g.33208 Transcript_14609/m.33208 type:complete len:1607 (+) Transcript_14609:138-4958(+)
MFGALLCLWTVALHSTLGYAARPTEPRALAHSNSFQVESEVSVDASESRDVARPTSAAEIEAHMQPGEECAKAERVEQRLRRTFRGSFTQARMAQRCSEWKVFSSKTCDDTAVGDAIILARVDEDDPLTRSDIHIIVPNDEIAVSEQAYVCCAGEVNQTSFGAGDRAPWCLAAIDLERSRPFLRWRLRDMCLRLHASVSMQPQRFASALRDAAEADSSLAADILELFIVIAFVLCFVTACISAWQSWTPRVETGQVLESRVLGKAEFWMDAGRAWGAMFAFVATTSTLLAGCLQFLADCDMQNLMLVVVLWPCFIGGPAITMLMTVHAKVELADAALFHGVWLMESPRQFCYCVFSFGMVAFVAFYVIGGLFNATVGLSHISAAVVVLLTTAGGPLWTLWKVALESWTLQRRLHQTKKLVNITGLLEVLGWSIEEHSLLKDPEVEHNSDDSQHVHGMVLMHRPPLSALPADGNDPRDSFDNDEGYCETSLDRELKEGRFTIVQMGIFAGLCGQGIEAKHALWPDITEHADLDAKGRCFRITDLHWQGRAVQQLAHTSAALWNIPVFLMLLVALVSMSLGWGALYCIEIPTLATLQPSSGTIFPPFSPYITEYSWIVEEPDTEFAIYTSCRSEWHSLDLNVSGLNFKRPEDGNHGKWKSNLQVALSKKRPNVAGTLQVTVYGFNALRSNKLTYNIRVTTIYRMLGVVRVMAGNKGDSLLAFDTSGQAVVNVAKPVSSLQVSLFEGILGVPYSRADWEREATRSEVEGVLTTIFTPFPASCKDWCDSERLCLRAIASRYGCFSIMGPKHMFGRELHERTMLKHTLVMSMHNIIRDMTLANLPGGKTCLQRGCTDEVLATSEDPNHLNLQLLDEVDMAQVQILLEWPNTSQVLSHIVDLHDGKGAKGLVQLSADLYSGRWSAGACKVSSVEYDEDSLQVAVNLRYDPMELGTPKLLLNLSGFSLDRGLSLSFPAQQAVATTTSSVVVQLKTWGVDAEESDYFDYYSGFCRSTDPRLLEMQLPLLNNGRMRSVMNRDVRLVVQRDDGQSPAGAAHKAMFEAGCNLNFSAFAYGSQEMHRLFGRMLHKMLASICWNIAAHCTEVYFHPPLGLVGAPRINGSMLNFLQWALEREGRRWSSSLQAVLQAAASNEDDKMLGEIAHRFLQRCEGKDSEGFRTEVLCLSLGNSSVQRPYLYGTGVFSLTDVGWADRSGRLSHALCRRFLPDFGAAEAIRALTAQLVVKHRSEQVVASLLQCLEVHWTSDEVHKLWHLPALRESLLLAVDAYMHSHDEMGTFKHAIITLHELAAGSTKARSLVGGLVSDVVSRGCTKCIDAGVIDGRSVKNETLNVCQASPLQRSLAPLRILAERPGKSVGMISSFSLQGCSRAQFIQLLRSAEFKFLWPFLGRTVKTLNLKCTPSDRFSLTGSAGQHSKLMTGALQRALQRVGKDNWVESISIGHCTIKNVAVALHLGRSMRNLTALSVLDLGNTNLFMGSAYYLLRDFCPLGCNLEALCLNSNRLTPHAKWSTQLGSLLVDSFRSLKVLDTSGNVAMTSSEANKFYDQLGKHPNLEVLYVGMYHDEFTESEFTTQLKLRLPRIRIYEEHCHLCAV